MDPHALCLALNMFFEARDQDFEGMMMVADVTIERVEDKRFPDSICGVVWQRKQFSWTRRAGVGLGSGHSGEHHRRRREPA